MAEKINHPQHYNTGKIEVIDAVEDWGFGEGFNRGNAIKYIARAGHKNPETEIEDLKKAKWYIEREIGRLTKLAEQSESGITTVADLMKGVEKFSEVAASIPTPDV